MKRLLTLIVGLAIVAATAYAEHFKFMGITMDGDLATFEKGLLAKGFTPQEDCEDNTPPFIFYEGTFHGQDVRLGVRLTPKSKKVVNLSIFYKIDLGEDTNATELEHLSSTIKSRYNVDKITSKYEGEIVYHYVNNYTGCIALHYVSPILITYFDMENHNLYNSECEEDI